MSPSGEPPAAAATTSLTNPGLVSTRAGRMVAAMTATARADITILAQLRTTHSVVSVVKDSVGGWLIWTAMKMLPATAAAAPAALVRLLVVTFMTGSFGLAPGGVSGDVQ